MPCTLSQAVDMRNQPEARSPEKRHPLSRAAHVEHGDTLTAIASAMDRHDAPISQILNTPSADKRSKT